MSIASLDLGNLPAGATAGGHTALAAPLGHGHGGMGLLIAQLVVATGRHLAELWLMGEVSMVSTDIQEVIRSAIAIKILNRGFLPFWAGPIFVFSPLNWCQRGRQHNTKPL